MPFCGGFERSKPHARFILKQFITKQKKLKKESFQRERK
jgi:hypothetical protein